MNSVRLVPDRGLGRTARAARNELRLAIRHAGSASTLGFMMLSILATSAAFREAARTFDEAMWSTLEKLIQANFSSLEYFAKVRGLNWQAALKRLPQCQEMIETHLKEMYPNFTHVAHPHTYVVSGNEKPLLQPRYKDQEQINIESNLYVAESFERRPSPRGWPVTKPYPSDPTITKEKCHLCDRSNCACDPLDSDKVVKPLVEIAKYGEKGNGIRVLEPIKKGDLLDEYVGEIKHADDVDDEVYSFSFDLHEGPTIANISSQFLGNWTRFINHSCDASTEFRLMVIGRRWRAVVVAIKDVGMFDELTIDYGPGYWVEGRLCKCGSSKCRYNKPKKSIDRHHVSGNSKNTPARNQHHSGFPQTSRNKNENPQRNNDEMDLDTEPAPPRRGPVVVRGTAARNEGASNSRYNLRRNNDRMELDTEPPHRAPLVLRYTPTSNKAAASNSRPSSRRSNSSGDKMDLDVPDGKNSFSLGSRRHPTRNESSSRSRPSSRRNHSGDKMDLDVADGKNPFSLSSRKLRTRNESSSSSSRPSSRGKNGDKMDLDIKTPPLRRGGGSDPLGVRNGGVPSRKGNREKKAFVNFG